MEFLNKLGSCMGTEFRKIDDLPDNTPILIDEWTAITTRYGRQIVITVNGVKYFLPSRFSKMTDLDVNAYNLKQITITFKGTKQFGRYPPTAILEFNDI